MKAKNRVTLPVTVACEALAVATLIAMVATGQYDRIPLAALTTGLVWLPELVQRLCRCRFTTPLYLFCVLYAIGPMLGQCHNFYYTISWWDKLLHISGGVLFAIVGVCFFRHMEPESRHPWMAAVFGLMFSMAVAVLWEFVEFAADAFLGMDMQDDVLIHGICSYLLGEQTGVTGRIDGIQSVIVNGTALPVAGYIDIGLFDSMLDMLLESLGDILTAAIVWLDKGRHSLIRSDSKEKIV